MMALVDAEFQFLYVRLGAQGTAGVFTESDFWQELDGGFLKVPSEKPLT